MQIAWDDEQKLSKRRVEREKGWNDAADDLSELSEGEKEKGDANQAEQKISRINSDIYTWPDDNNPRRLYIVLIRYSILFLFLFIFLVQTPACFC